MLFEKKSISKYRVNTHFIFKYVMFYFKQTFILQNSGVCSNFEIKRILQLF